MVIPAREKRQFPRLGIKAPLRYQIMGDPDYGNAETDDISIGGLGFYNPDFIAPQTPLRIEFNVLSRVLNACGKVSWALPLPHTNRYRIGVEFSEIPLREKNYLTDYINLHKPEVTGLL